MGATQPGSSLAACEKRRRHPKTSAANQTACLGEQVEGLWVASEVLHFEYRLWRGQVEALQLGVQAGTWRPKVGDAGRDADAGAALRGARACVGVLGGGRAGGPGRGGRGVPQGRAAALPTPRRSGSPFVKRRRHYARRAGRGPHHDYDPLRLARLDVGSHPLEAQRREHGRPRRARGAAPLDADHAHLLKRLRRSPRRRGRVGERTQQTWLRARDEKLAHAGPALAVRRPNTTSAPAGSLPTCERTHSVTTPPRARAHTHTHIHTHTQ